jgi:hypothetical protein
MVDLEGCGEAASGLFCLSSNIILVSVTAFGDAFPRKVVGLLSSTAALILVWLVVVLVGIASCGENVCDPVKVVSKEQRACMMRYVR